MRVVWLNMPTPVLFPDTGRGDLIIDEFLRDYLSSLGGMLIQVG